MDRKYRVYAHSCYVQGLAYIDPIIIQRGKGLEAAARFYNDDLDHYPNITEVVILAEKHFSHLPPRIGPLTIVKGRVCGTEDKPKVGWQICERDHEGWRRKDGWYFSLNRIQNVLRDITRLRANRQNALGDDMPFWAILKYGSQHVPF